MENHKINMINQEVIPTLKYSPTPKILPMVAKNGTTSRPIAFLTKFSLSANNKKNADAAIIIIKIPNKITR